MCLDYFSLTVDEMAYKGFLDVSLEALGVDLDSDMSKMLENSSRLRRILYSPRSSPAYQTGKEVYIYMMDGLLQS
jgi:hypothetical protein